VGEHRPPAARRRVGGTGGYALGEWATSNDLISDVLPFGRLWYDGPNAASNAIGYTQQYSRSHDAVIRSLRSGGRRHRNARVQGRFQRTVERRIAGSLTEKVRNG